MSISLLMVLSVMSDPDVIVVRAEKSGIAIADIPSSVAVIGDDFLRSSGGLGSAEDLADRVIGVEVARANGIQNAFQIRGIGAVDHQALTPSAAAVYVNGVFLAQNVQTSFLPFDVERVEVARGPQGTLYGRNASSGAIQFVTTRPSSDQPGYLRLGIGSFDLTEAEGAAGWSIGDATHARVAGRALRKRSVLDNVSATDAFPQGPDRAGGDREELAARISIAHDFADDRSLLVSAHVAVDKGVNPAPRNSALDVGDHEISVGPDGVQDTDSAFFGASAEYQAGVGVWDLVSITAYEGYDQNYGFDFDGTEAPFGVASLNANLRYDREFGQLSQEVRVRREWNDHQVLIGALGTHDWFEQDYLIWCGTLDETSLLGTCRYVGAPGRVGSTPASSGTATSLLSVIEQDHTQLAIFTHNVFSLTERLALSVGGRISWDRTEAEGEGIHIFDDGIRAFNNRDDVGAAVGKNDIADTQPSYHLGATYAVVDGLNAYASVSTGYKSGGFNGEVINNATHFTDEGLFGKEEVTAFEVGVKSEARENVSFSAALFHQLYDDPQARIFVAFPQPDGSVITSNSLSNLDEANVTGAEAELRWAPSSGLDLRAGVQWLDTEIDQQDTNDAIGNSALFDGNPLPFAPEWSGTLSGSYRIDLPAGRALTLDGHAKYRSEYFLDAEGRDDRREDGYTIVNGAVSLEGVGPARLRLYGTNLLDEDYAVSGYGFIGYNTFRGAPREYGVQVGFEF